MIHCVEAKANRAGAKGSKHASRDCERFNLISAKDGEGGVSWALLTGNVGEDRGHGGLLSRREDVRMNMVEIWCCLFEHMQQDPRSGPRI